MRPDPWSVVEYHARAAASAQPDEAMTSQQRLALYAAAAPEVIGATHLATDDGVEWWSAPAPGSPLRLVWSNRGDLLLASPATAMVRQWVVGGVTGVLVFTTLSPEVRLWGMIPAILLGLTAAFVVQRVKPAWARFGDHLDPVGAQRAMETFVARYERDVPLLPPAETP